jgi:hypothetical protein
MKKTTSIFIKSAFTGVFFCILVFCSWNCIEKPLSPVLAASEVSLESIPLIDITKYFEEYAEKPRSNISVVGSEGMYDYVNTENVEKQSVTLPVMNATDTSLQVMVGSFSVGSLSSSDSLAASTLGFPSSGSSYIPPITTTVGPQALGDTSTLRYVQLSDATGNTLSLTIKNNLPVRVAFQPIVLRNNWASPLDTSWVASFAIPDTLAAGASKTYTTSIAGKKMWGLLKTDSIKVYTPGATTATFTSNSSLTFALKSGSLMADSAVALIPSVTVYEQNNADWVIDDSTILSSATFDGGKFNLKFVNSLDLGVKVNVTINELVNIGSGASYSIDTTIAKNTTTTLPQIDMSKYRVTGGTAANSTIGTKLTYSGSVKTLTPATAGVKQAVRKTDYITASLIQDSAFVLKSLTGRIKTTTVNVNERFASNINVNDLENFTGSLVLDSAKIGINLPMGGGDGCEASYSVTIIAENTKQGRMDSLTLTGTFEPGTGTNIQLGAAKDTAFFNSLARYLPNVPDYFRIRGTVVLDPNFTSDTKTYSFHDTSKVYPSFDIHLPLRFSLGSSVFAQTIAFDSTQIPTDFTKNVGEGSVSFIVLNNLPLQMDMKAAFLRRNKGTNKCDTLFWLPKTDTVTNTVDSLHILAAPVNSAGWATGSTRSTSKVSLNHSDMTDFNRTDSIYVRLYNLQTTGGKTVRVLGSNYIRINATGNIKYTVKAD